MAPRDRYGNHPYGPVHKAQRKRFAARMRAGEVFHCWRPSCLSPGVPINPRSWDLGHVDPEFQPRFGSRWPEHPRCNRSTVTHLREKLAGGVQKESVATYSAAVTDRFGGLPDPDPGNTATDWSRHWCGPFNPRCRECRRLGGPCEVAQRLEAEAA